MYLVELVIIHAEVDIIMEVLPIDEMHDSNHSIIYLY